MKRIVVLLAPIVLLLASGAAHLAPAAGPNAVVYLAGCDSGLLPANDDDSTGIIDLQFGINFLGTTYNTLYVNNNGNVTFDAPLSTYTPFPLIGANRVIIAPFFGDVDTRGSGSGLVTYGYGTFDGRPVFCVTWDGVGVGYYSQAVDKLNMFQLLLVDRSDVGAGDFDIIFNYDQIQWETGDASGGSGGLGGASARVGYSNGNALSPLSFELPGSAVNGALLDGSPTGLTQNSRNSVQVGRYIFPVRNGAPPAGGQIDGTVNAPGFVPVLGAFVQVCPKGGGPCLWSGTTNSLGNYAATGLPDGDYNVKAFPPAGSTLIPAQIDPTIAGGSHVTGADVLLGLPVPPPTGTTIFPSTTGGGGLPVIFWGNQTTVTTTGCPGGTATYEIYQGAATLASGSMTESPAGSGNYSAAVPAFYPNHGDAIVHMHVVCPGGSASDVTFVIYIDPSGVVRNVGGAPIGGATVTLFRSDTGAPGSFTQVPDGSGVMSPSNRTNPDQTNALGQFGWDVIAGYYVVRAEKADCLSPDHTQSYVDSPVLTIPPAVIDLDLRLYCGRQLDALSPAKVWVGLKNSDDVGTRFDLKAEVYVAGALVGSGELDGVAGGSSGFNHARQSSIPLTLFAPVEIETGATLAITLSVRNTCSGRTHNSGTARLWFDDGQAKSRFDATIDGTATDYYLRSGSALNTTAGSGPKRTADVFVDNTAACPARPFTPFGTWSIAVP